MYGVLAVTRKERSRGQGRKLCEWVCASAVSHPGCGSGPKSRMPAASWRVSGRDVSVKRKKKGLRVRVRRGRLGRQRMLGRADDTIIRIKPCWKFKLFVQCTDMVLFLPISTRRTVEAHGFPVQICRRMPIAGSFVSCGCSRGGACPHFLSRGQFSAQELQERDPTGRQTDSSCSFF